MRVTTFRFAIAPTLLFVSGALAQDAPVLKPVAQPYEVSSDFVGKTKKKQAKDISGIACLPATGAGPRRCLVVNDQNRKAQFVQIRDRTLVPGEQVELIGKEPSKKTLGRAPEVETCPGGKADFADLDGEGVASVGSFFYVVGSHGCTRRDRQLQLSSFILARVALDAKGEQAGEAETTYRLADALRSAPTVGAAFGKGLNEENGLNIEGLAIIGDRLFVGLRAPSLNETAYIVSASVPDLFAPGDGPLQAAPEVIPLALGKDAGIRDIAPLPDGRLLVLSGPAQEQKDVPYSLFVAEPRPGGALKRIGVLEALPEKDENGNQKGQAEAVALLDSDRVLILFDSLPNGGPREYRISLD